MLIVTLPAQCLFSSFTGDWGKAYFAWPHCVRIHFVFWQQRSCCESSQHTTWEVLKIHPSWERCRGKRFYRVSSERSIKSCWLVLISLIWNSNNFLKSLEEKLMIWTLAGESVHVPDLLLVYGPVRSHLGFPAWRLRYTEIVYVLFP